MTKLEKYFKGEIKPQEAYYLLFEFARYFSLLPMNNSDDIIDAYAKIIAFLHQPYKPSLTEDEKVILKSMPHLKSVSRNRENDIWFTYQEEQKYGVNGESILGFNHLFQFIQPRKRI